MGVVRAQMQTVEEIYRLVWTTVANKKPIQANYQAGIVCFVRTGWGGIERGSFEYSAINMAATVRVASIQRVRRDKLAVYRAGEIQPGGVNGR
jgi:hypothetical protein